MYLILREGRPTTTALRLLILDVLQALFEQTPHVRIVQAIENVATLAAETHQSHVAHVAKLMRDGGLLHLQRRDQVSHAQLPLSQQRDDAQAGRVAQRFEHARQPYRHRGRECPGRSVAPAAAVAADASPAGWMRAWFTVFAGIAHSRLLHLHLCAYDHMIGPSRRFVKTRAFAKGCTNRGMPVEWGAINSETSRCHLAGFATHPIPDEWFSKGSGQPQCLAKKSLWAEPVHQRSKWVRDPRGRYQIAKIPFFPKQWGGLTPYTGGRLLDGRTWNEAPSVFGKSEQLALEAVL